MDIHAEIKLAEEVTRRGIDWCTRHAEHLAGIAASVASGPVGQALADAAGVLLPEDEATVAAVIRVLAEIRRNPEVSALTAPAAPQEAADAPAPVTEGDDPAPGSDEAQGASEGAVVVAEPAVIA